MGTTSYAEKLRSTAADLTDLAAEQKDEYHLTFAVLMLGAGVWAVAAEIAEANERTMAPSLGEDDQ